MKRRGDDFKQNQFQTQNLKFNLEQSGAIRVMLTCSMSYYLTARCNELSSLPRHNGLNSSWIMQSSLVHLISPVPTDAAWVYTINHFADTTHHLFRILDSLCETGIWADLYSSNEIQTRWSIVLYCVWTDSSEVQMQLPTNSSLLKEKAHLQHFTPY